MEDLQVETDLTYSNSGTVDSLALLGQCVMLFLPFPELTAARLLQRRDRFLADSRAIRPGFCILVLCDGYGLSTLVILRYLEIFGDIPKKILTLSYHPILHYLAVVLTVLTHSRLKDLRLCQAKAPWFVDRYGQRVGDRHIIGRGNAALRWVSSCVVRSSWGSRLRTN